MQALKGVTVVTLEHAIAAPFCTRQLADLGARSPVVTGNLKFDASAPDGVDALGREFRVRFGTARPVWVAASTRDGEEAMLLDALAATPLPPGTLTVSAAETSAESPLPER